MTETRQITDTEFRIDTLIRREADPQDETTESGIMRAAQTIAAEIDALTAGRDGFRDAYAAQGAILAAARYEVGRLTRMRDFERDAVGTMADQYSILAEERNALKAEVERLRPAAEAWRAAEAMTVNDLAEVESSGDRLHDYNAAAARARAAKERKP